MNIFGKVADWFGSLWAKAEDVVHEPLEPIKEYQAFVTGGLWRGAWPSVSTLNKLRVQGIKIVVNLCEERNQNNLVTMCNLIPFNISIKDTETPMPDQVSFFCYLVAAYQNVYVHCEEGIGRTGCVVAAYRVKVQNWTPEAALKEAESFGVLYPDQKAFILGLKP